MTLCIANSGPRFELPALEFYEMAYAAFRMGLCWLCAQREPAGSDERRRLEQAQAFYRKKLENRLLVAKSMG